MKISITILLAVICSTLVCADPGQEFPAGAEIQGMKYISDSNAFLDESSEKLTSDQKKALVFAKSVLSLYLDSTIRGEFRIAEAKWGYQITFTKLERKEKGVWTDATEGFGEVFLSKHFSRIQIDYGP